ncbi:MAG: alkaline phosphatase family protein [Desulfofustis sp.]|nr:alkaline phosphatase family protein [Desulfofustis sp.]
MNLTLKNKTIVFMIDGFDIRYFEETPMPVMQTMARDGFFKCGSALFPSLTNANNISIACGCWPEKHGVTTNCYYDEASGRAVFLEHADFLTTPTLFQRGAATGMRSALLTCKAKTTKILGSGVSFIVAAEDPDDAICRQYGPPPPMYSTEINYWLFDIALDLVTSKPEIDLIYVHTTDYPMHMWPPDADESQQHMRRIDDYLGKFLQAAPDHTIALTADHGMNYKKRCWDLTKACANRGVNLKFAVSPVADRLLKHHRGFGGVSFVYLNHPDDAPLAATTISSLKGVEAVLDRKTAAHRFSLMPSRIGDLVVLPDRDTVFGDLPEESEKLPADYRSHGSLHDMRIPLLLYNCAGEPPRYQDINYNVDVTRFLFSREG